MKSNSIKIRLSPAKLVGTIEAIPSKSIAHRALICAALAYEPTFVECLGDSKDIAATIECLAKLKCGSGCKLPVGESGSTFRFLLPIVAALGVESSFILEGRLPERPLSPLYEELVRHGCTLSPKGSNPFKIKGKLTSGEYSLNAEVSSQFISGLLFALPLLNGDSILRITGEMASAPYVDLTLAMLERFSVKTEFKDNTFYIPGRQIYRSPGTIRVEGDWSNAAFWLCAGALSENAVTVTGLDLQSKQGDRAVLEILERFGAKVRAEVGGNGDSVTVSCGELCGITIDARNIPDLVPILSVVAAAAKGTTTIHGAERLRAKESDRFAAVTEVLTALGAEISEGADVLVIHGGVALKGGTISGWNDHRIVMSAAVAATLLCNAPVTIEGAEAVDKSYPGFFEDLQTLGGIISIMGEGKWHHNTATE